MEYIDKEKMIKNIVSSMSIEDMFVPDDTKIVIQKYLNNEITEEMGVEYIKEKYK